MKNKAQNSTEGKTHRNTVVKLMTVAVCMFGFGFAMVPLYEVFCDVTGLGGRSVQVADNGDQAVASDREIGIRFLATTNSGLPWEFEPSVKSATVKLGEMSETLYLAMNTSEQPLLGHATYNVVPAEASLYFVKTECFCFTQQLLLAQESREMPVYYYVQADLPEDIKEITLSYTFYPNDDKEALSLAMTSAQDQD